MKKRVQNRSSGFIRSTITVITLAALWVMTLPLGAEAALQGSAGNTIIRNKVTVNYNDSSNNAQLPVSVALDVTVNTVNVAPTILTFSPAPGNTDGNGATQAYTVTVRTNSNGPGSITLGAADGGFTNVAAGAVPTITGSVFLGSSIFDPSNFPAMGAQNIAINGLIVITVPNDGGVPTDAATTGGGTDNVINGLAVNDRVYVTDGTNYYGPFQVTAVTDPAVGAGTTAAPGSVTLQNVSTGAVAFTPAAGWQIVESKTATLTVTQGTVSDPTAVASWVTTVTGTMGGQNGTGNVTTNAHGGRLAVTKYSRNVTSAVVGSGATTVNINGGNKTYYTGGVSGKPNDVIEYLIKVTNTGTGAAKAVTATDAVPTYTTLVAAAPYGGVAGSGNFFALAQDNGGTEASLTTLNADTENTAIACGNSTGTIAGSALTFYLGTSNTNAAGGTITTGQTWYVIYQASIN